jgi:outer membrane protein TolC
MNKLLIPVGVAMLALAGICHAEPALASQNPVPSRPTMEVDISSRNAGRSVDLTLADAIYMGLQDNRAIRTAYLGRISQRSDLAVSEDRFTPKLILSSRFLSQRSDQQRWRTFEVVPVATMTSPVGTRVNLAWTGLLNKSGRAPDDRNANLNLAIVQPLLRDAGWEVGMAPVRLGRLIEESNRLNLKSQLSRIVTQIIYAYRELIRTQEQVTISRESLDRSRKLLDINRGLVASGRMAEFDVVQTEADVLTQEVNVEEALNQLDQRRMDLVRLLALDLTTPLHAMENLEPSAVKIDLAGAKRIAVTNQPDYLIQQIASKQAEINLAVARNQRLWDVSLISGATRQTQRQGPVADRQWSGYVGIQLEIPIGDLGRQQGEVHANTAVQTQALQLEESRQQLEQNVTNAVRDIETRWRQFGLSQRARDFSLKKIEIEREKLTLGRSSNFQVISFEADLRNAENARLNALLAYLNAQIELDLQLGLTLESWKISLND